MGPDGLGHEGPDPRLGVLDVPSDDGGEGRQEAEGRRVRRGGPARGPAPAGLGDFRGGTVRRRRGDAGSLGVDAAAAGSES